jgi:CBS domain-containing protein
MDTTVSVVLRHKGFGVVAVNPSVSVWDAVVEMNQHRIGAVLVVEGNQLAGIFTERDVLTRVVAADLDPKRTPITSVMTRDPITVPPEASLQQVMDVFNGRSFRHMPVVEAGRLQGVISIGDISRWVAEQHRYEAEQLRSYITGYPAALAG